MNSLCHILVFCRSVDAKEAERQRNIKIEALKAQAEERGRRLKSQLEKHRKEALAREMKQQANRSVGYDYS